MARWSAGLVVALILVALPGSGRAEHSGLFLPAGANIGKSLHDSRPNGEVFGLELSFVKSTIVDNPPINVGFWRGAYIDGLMDTGAETIRLSLGPEVGYGLVGIDGGVALELGSDEGAHFGFVLRPVLTTGIVALYFRGGYLFGDGAGAFGESGILIKLPIWTRER